MKEEYKKRVGLLLEILPFALQDNRVALKGGTAINLFHRDFPRLSVDIDLCYTPLEEREKSFRNIHKILVDTKTNIEKKLKLKVESTDLNNFSKEAKLFVHQGKAMVKIEPNYIIRGSLYAPEVIKLAKKTEQEFNKSTEVLCLNLADTYGGKICAALDRQHPRDLFDVKQLLEKEGINQEIKDSFIFYLISHKRPINEILAPNLKDISSEFKNEFVDMTSEKVTLSELYTARDELITKVNAALSSDDKKFLESFVSNQPDWSLINNPQIKDYPSVKWKLFNQGQMAKGKQEKYIKAVKEILD